MLINQENLLNNDIPPLITLSTENLDLADNDTSHIFLPFLLLAPVGCSNTAGDFLTLFNLT